ncbi:MAG: helix-turn-helix transcriptional regulator [Clostridiales bacterium]|nr:helix-turn-helix transcriptional regulator [Clostridiales bacterium]
MEELKQTIAENLVAYRKQAQLTQQELAEKINYSDKAVSKWERAEGVPDVLVLKAIADLYGVTVNDFLVDHTKPKKLRFKDFWAKRWLITLLSAGLVFFIATIVVFIWLVVAPASAADVAKYTYLTALPIACIVVLVFSCIWGKLWQRCLAVSALVWTLCLLIHLALNIVTLEYTWMIYVVGAAMQLLVILWFILVYFVKRGKAVK